MNEVLLKVHIINPSLQNEAAESSRIKTSKMQSQQAGFDDQMARAELEAVGMKSAYEKLKLDNIEQRETAVQVLW